MQKYILSETLLKTPHIETKKQMLNIFPLGKRNVTKHARFFLTSLHSLTFAVTNLT